MTYRNKLMLKRILIVLAILIAVLLVLAVIVFTYLGRYVVYTEDGAYFSFHAQTSLESPEVQHAAAPSQIELVMGESVSAGEVLGNDEHNIPDTEVKGILLDYSTLLDGSTLNALELSGDDCNTLVLEMRTQGSQLLNTQQVLNLISRAKTQEVRLIALISCLDDSEYALAHKDEAFQIYSEALWMNSDGNYYLDPTKDAVIEYLAGIIEQLSEMGFEEVILNEFSIPESDSIDLDTGDSTLDELMVRAFNDLLDATIDFCDIGLLVTDPNEGHQAMDAAERIYVYFAEGSEVKGYAERHPDHYLVFVTDSHDTRFDGYGKISTERELGLDADNEEDE